MAARLSKETGTTVKLPYYKQVRTAVQHLKMDPELVAMREGAKSVARPRESAESFVLSIPAPTLLTQVDEHTMDLYVVTPDGTTVASRVHQDWDTLRQQRRYVLWEQAVAASGVPQYLGSPDDLKLLLMKAVNRKTPHHGYRVQNGNRLSFQWC